MTNDPPDAVPPPDASNEQPASPPPPAVGAENSTTGRIVLHADVMAFAKIGAIGLMVIGVLYLAWLFLIRLFDQRSLLNVYGFYGGGTLLGNDLLSAIVSIVGFLIALGITGFLGAALFAWLYNITLKWIGGLHLDVDVPATGGSSGPTTGTKRTLRHVDVLSYARIGVLVGIVLGAIYIIILLVLVLFDSRPLLSVYAMYGVGNLLGDSLLAAIIAIIGWLLGLMITAFVWGLLTAWLFNIGAKWIGGIPMTVALSSTTISGRNSDAAPGTTAIGGSGALPGTARRTIRHVDVASYTKYSAVGNSLIALAFNLVLLLIIALGVQSVLPNFGFFDGGDLLGKDWPSRIASIVGTGITWAIIGAISGALLAWLFNATEKWTHGVHVDLS